VKHTYKKVALAYSGGLDTSIIIPWLKENYGCEVVAVAVDVGQAEETDGLAEKAYRTGACDFHLIDAREEFARDFLFPVLKAGAIYEKDYLLGTSTARTLIARSRSRSPLVAMRSRTAAPARETIRFASSSPTRLSLRSWP